MTHKVMDVQGDGSALMTKDEAAGHGAGTGKWSSGKASKCRHPHASVSMWPPFTCTDCHAAVAYVE